MKTLPLSTRRRASDGAAEREEGEGVVLNKRFGRSEIKHC